jgi:digeranylgeranylglycerophospholipid reductase
MKTTSDTIVVGGGPCGSFAALNITKQGLSVDVFEEHKEIGMPSHCAGHISIKGLKSLGLFPLSEQILENTFYGATFHSPNGKTFSIRFPRPVTCAVNRVLFDKYIAEKAQKAGAVYHENSRISSLTIENDMVKGVISNREGKTEKHLTKIVIDAEGISSRLLKQTGLPTLDRGKLVNAVQAEVENVKDIEMDTVEVFLGRNYCPGFYAWLIPKKDGNAKVGLAAKRGNPRELLLKLMTKHPTASKKLGDARILQTSFHPITLGGPISKAYSEGFLAVGDVASQVKPTTGGGIILGMTCAKIAADVACEAVRKGDVSSETLGAYQQKCDGILGFNMRIMLRIRRMLDSLSDEKIDKIIALCSQLGLDKTLRNVNEIDFQGQTLLQAVRNPRVLPVLFYFFFLYLSANP